MDWKNKNAVIALAKSMGAGMTVIKRPELPNFNVIHTNREADLLRDAEVIARTYEVLSCPA